MKVLGLAFPTPAKSQGLESAWPVSELPITRQCGRASLLCVDEVLRPTRRELRQQSVPGRVGVRSCSWLLEDMMHAARTTLRHVPRAAFLSNCDRSGLRAKDDDKALQSPPSAPLVASQQIRIMCAPRHCLRGKAEVCVACGSHPWAVRCRDCRHESISRGTRSGLLLGQRCKVLCEVSFCWASLVRSDG